MFSFSHFSLSVICRWVFICVAFILTGCSEPTAAPQSPPVPVSVVELNDIEVRPSRDFVARTAASARADLSARIEAEIKQILFVEGAKVAQDQVLIRLEDTRLRADLQQSKAELVGARAELSSAQRNLIRGEDIAGKGYLSDADLDRLKDRFNSAQSRVEAAEAALQIAQTNLAYAEIKSPFAGWVGRQNYDEGAVVSPASGPISDVLMTDPIYVEFQVDEADYVAFQRSAQAIKTRVTEGLSLHLTLPDGGSFDQVGKLNFSDVETDARTGTIAMRAVFPNPDAILLPGLYVTLKIESVAEGLQVLVPQVAIQETIEGKFVLLVDDQNKIVQRFIKTGARVGAMLVTESGLTSGEKVVVEGLQKVRSGVAVIPIIKQINLETGELTETGSSQNETSQ